MAEVRRMRFDVSRDRSLIHFQCLRWDKISPKVSEGSG